MAVTGHNEGTWVMVGAFPSRREERVHDLPGAVVVVGHEVRVSDKDNFLRVAKVGSDLGQAEPFRQPCRGGSVPQHVTAVLPSPLRVNASGPPCGLPQTVKSVAVQRPAVMLTITLAVTGAPAPHVTAGNIAAIAVLGIIGTGFAYVLNYQIITSEGATVASTVTYLLPVVAIVLGVLVLDESITVAALSGIALVLVGVALTRRRAKPASAEASPPG
jgi:uncharacterized membrane protein